MHWWPLCSNETRANQLILVRALFTLVPKSSTTSRDEAKCSTLKACKIVLFNSRRLKLWKREFDKVNFNTKQKQISLHRHFNSFLHRVIAWKIVIGSKDWSAFVVFIQVRFKSQISNNFYCQSVFDAYGPHTGPFFLCFSQKWRTGPYGSYDKYISYLLCLMRLEILVTLLLKLMLCENNLLLPSITNNVREASCYSFINSKEPREIKGVSCQEVIGDPRHA